MYEEKGRFIICRKSLRNRWNNVRLYWSQNPSEPLNQLALYSNIVTKITDSWSTALSCTTQPNRDQSASRSRNRRIRILLNVSNEGEALPKVWQTQPWTTRRTRLQVPIRHHTLEYAFERTTGWWSIKWTQNTLNWVKKWKRTRKLSEQRRFDVMVVVSIV